MKSIPLGQQETGTLEFKRKDSLSDPESIGREVVGMLNSNGGEIWIGIREEAGTAVALDPVSDPEGARQSLRDYLTDALEPSPQGDEVETRIERDNLGQAVLCIRVRPSENRRPYALLKRGGRHFLIRTEDRLRVMAREEVLQPHSDATGLPGAEKKLREQGEDHRTKRENVYWIALKPCSEVTVDIQDPKISNYLKDASLTGNRPHGWNFINPYDEPKLRNGRLVGYGVEVWNNGGLSLTKDVDEMRYRGREREIHPYALIEYPVALFRLAACLYRDLGVGDSVTILADAALLGIKGWMLRPYSPRDFHYERPLWDNPHAWNEDMDLFLDRALRLPVSEVISEPDWCGFRLVRHIYEAFGYPEDRIPAEFNREKRRLLIPD